MLTPEAHNTVLHRDPHVLSLLLDASSPFFSSPPLTAAGVAGGG